MPDLEPAIDALCLFRTFPSCLLCFNNMHLSVLKTIQSIL